MKKYSDLDQYSDGELASALKEEAVEYKKLQDMAIAPEDRVPQLRIVGKDIERLSSEIHRRSLKSPSDMVAATDSRVYKFDPLGSGSRYPSSTTDKGHTLMTEAGPLSWKNQIERLRLIRAGLPYDAIDQISLKANLPIKRLLDYLGLAQTTYNKRKREDGRLTRRDSEVLLMLVEVLDYGVDVFNEELDKFHRWLQKANLSLGGITPIDLFDSITGITEVRRALDRLEYGNMA